MILGLKDAELVHGRPSNLADLRQIWHNYVKNRVISRLSHVDHVSLLRIYLTIDLGLLDLRNRLTYTWSSSATLFQIRKSNGI